MSVDSDQSSAVSAPVTGGKPLVKKVPLMIGIVSLLAVASFLAGGFSFNPVGQDRQAGLKEPGIFVAEEVVSAERQDLAVFAQIWQQALSQNLSFEEYKSLALTTGGRFANTPVLKVGQETIYGNDLNYLALFYAFDDYVKAAPLSQPVLNRLADLAMEDSMWLQKAAERGLLNLKPEVFNSAEKNYTERNRLITLAPQALGLAMIERISGEAVAIWFNNDGSPQELTVSERKALAYQKIKLIHDRILAGEINFKQAGEIIANDSQIGQQLDKAYKNNAYMSFSQLSRNEGPFSFENLNDEVWSLGEGQVSGILVGKDSNSLEAEAENLYLIVKVDQRSGEVSPKNSQELIDEMVDQVEKINLQ